MTVSPSTKSDLKQFGINNVTIVPNGTDSPPKLSNFPKEKVFTAIYLSTLTKDKGVEDAIKAFNLINQSLPDSRFWIVGKGEPAYVEYLHSLLPQATFFDYVSEQTKFELLSKAHILIFPSVHEGWGLVILEAASVGTPTIAYRVSGVKDAVVNGKTGLLSSQINPESLANLAIQLRANPALYKKMQNECKVWSQKFRWDKSQKLSLKLIESLV